MVLARDRRVERHDLAPERGREYPGTVSPQDAVPEATVARLPLYHRALMAARAMGTTTVSSEDLAAQSGVNAAKVRKDLSHLGSYGTRGVGYDVERLLFEVSGRLGLTSELPVAVVGMGNLGRALANHRGFSARGFPVVAVFDVDTKTIGTKVGAVRVDHIGQLRARVDELGIGIAVIATPADQAQDVAEELIDAGVHALLNFAPVVLTVPDHVSVRDVDVTRELQVLSFYQHVAQSNDGRAAV